MPHYNASKAALINFTKSLSKAYPAQGILVNTVSPAFIMTPMLENLLNDIAKKLNISYDEAIQQFVKENRPHVEVYHLKLKYSADEASNATVNVRDVKSGENTYSKPISLKATHGRWKEANEKVKLKEGTNLVTVNDASGNFNLDSITLGNSQVDNTTGTLQNGDFNEGFDNWSRSNMVNQSIVNGAVQIGGTDANPFNSDLWQYVVPKAGTYTLTADVKRNGNFNDAYLYVENGKDKQLVEVPTSDNMKKVTISKIKVSKGEVLKIGNIANAKVGGTLTMDHVQLIRGDQSNFLKNLFMKNN
jgi:hypothetical protein